MPGEKLMPNDCRLLKVTVCTVLCALAQFSVLARSAGAQPLAWALADLDARLARIEEAIFTEPVCSPRIIAPTGRVSHVEQISARIHARLARIETAMVGKALPIPRTIAPTGAVHRRPSDRSLADLDARVARIERMIVGSVLPGQESVSFTGVVYRSGSEKSLASLNGRLWRIEHAVYMETLRPTPPLQESPSKEDQSVNGQ